MSIDSGRSRGRPRTFDRHEALCRALRVFWEKGYDGATMNDLCKAMGVSSPSIYCAFGNKKELFLEALRFYRETYWQPLFSDFFAEEDIHIAICKLFDATARVLLAPEVPCGCLTVLTAMRKPLHEPDIMTEVERMRMETRTFFRERLKIAVQARQLPPDSNIPAIAGALVNFFEGLTLQAQGDICQGELLAIAGRAVGLLPPPRKNSMAAETKTHGV